MPTGYTADIKDGIDFKTYAMNCARAFGACVSLRDEPGGGERIPDAFEASDYHMKELERCRAELAALDAMTPTKREIAASNAWMAAETNRIESLHRCRDLRSSYEAMLAQVEAWIPPTPEHVDLQKFMREQIEKSIEFDCIESYYNKFIDKLSGKAWAEAGRARLYGDLQYHEKGHADEVSRAATRTAWVRALRASLQDRSAQE